MVCVYTAQFLYLVIVRFLPASFCFGSKLY